LPLAATWLMMAVEGPFIAAIIARLAEPKYNLAAYWVAYAFALIIEAPVIMMLSAATALVKDKQSFLKLRSFTYLLNGIITAVMLVILIPPVFDWITMKLMSLPENIAHLTHRALIILLPWPGAIGYRRFYQGILIRNNLTRRVAYGTVIRLLAMSSCALILYHFFEVHGAYVGAAALTAGVSIEAIMSRLMVHKTLQKICADQSIPQAENMLNYRKIRSFYTPLALTSLIGLAVHPLVTFFLGQSRFPVESLAVMSVIHSLVFIFRSLGLSFMEVVVALIGEDLKGYLPLRRFAIMLGSGVVCGLGVIAFTPLSEWWFEVVSGLSTDLADFALTPTRILVLMPALSVLLSFQRGILVMGRKTTAVSIATGIEVSAIIIILSIAIYYLNAIGAIAAAAAFILGRLSSNTYMFHHIRKVLLEIKSV